jgi:hypothetical protein
MWNCLSTQNDFVKKKWKYARPLLLELNQSEITGEIEGKDCFTGE